MVSTLLLGSVAQTPLSYNVAACSQLTYSLQGEYGSSGVEAAYNGGHAAFAAAYGGQAGYPSSAVGTSGQDAYGTNALYSQGFASASQVGCPHPMQGPVHRESIAMNFGHICGVALLACDLQQQNSNLQQMP